MMLTSHLKQMVWVMLFLLPLPLLSQTYVPYQFPKSIPDAYVFNSYGHYLEILEEKRPKQISKNQYKRYAETVAYGKEARFRSGLVYLGWHEMENYLNAVMKQMLPDSLKNRENIRVYPQRQADYNAFAIHDGSMFFNIGLFADVSSEAGLAIILGHELAHYLNNDVQDNFFKRLATYKKNKRNDNFYLALDNAFFNRMQETEADSVGYVMAANGGYKLAEGVKNFYRFLELEQKMTEITERKKHTDKETATEKKQKGIKALLALLSTHPETVARIENLEKLLHEQQVEEKNRRKFIVDEALFKKLQQQARYETLHILLSQNHYKSCIEKSFRYHLLEPENHNFQYYLYESIRRYLYINPNYATRPFMNQYDTWFEEEKGILGNLHLIVKDSFEYAGIKAKELLDTSVIEFVTYTEALKYFGNLSLQNGVAECLLSHALNNFKAVPIRDSFLNEYLKRGNVRYREYANSLLEDNFDMKTSKKLMLMDDIVFIEDHRYGLHNRLILAEQRNPKYKISINYMTQKNFPGMDVVNMSELAANDIKNYIEFYRILTITSMIRQKIDNQTGGDFDAEAVYFQTAGQSKGKKIPRRKITGKQKRHLENINLFVADPDIWYLFKNQNISDLGYIKVVAFDDKTSITKGAIFYLNPFVWATATIVLATRAVRGSPRYGYMVHYFAFSPMARRNKIFNSSEIVNYKLTRTHLQHTLFSVFNGQK